MAIGGYFELELNDGVEYHAGAIHLNSGRNAFEYILRAKKYSKVYLPHYTCHSMLSSIRKLGISLQRFAINENMEPAGELPRIGENEVMVYTNYFGLKDTYIRSLSKKVKNLIIDNAQSFFSPPLESVDTFYSPRKFFGVPDGAYLYTDTALGEPLEREVSYKRMQHLLIRIDEGPEAGYAVFHEEDNELGRQPLKAMSRLTQQLLKNIDYEMARKKRVENYLALDDKLSDVNKIKFTLGKSTVPMVYPLLVEDAGIRDFLIRNKIYVARYWPNVLEDMDKDSLEYKMAMNIIPLPVDQRFTLQNMEEIVRRVQEYFTRN